MHTTTVTETGTENCACTCVKDKPALNLSRSSVPNGLLIMDTHAGSCVVTSQKFAKGTRFGPLLAQKSYVPIKNLPFPLVLFAGPYYQQEEHEYSNDLQALLSGTRNVYLDTRNESKCNWMIHVNLARFSNEQNLICYQENDEIYYTAIKDIELGDILRVWYSRNYAAKIGASMLEPSPYDICTNILRSVSMDYGFDLDKNQTSSFLIDDVYNRPSVTVGSCGSTAGHITSVSHNSAGSSTSSTMTANGTPCISSMVLSSSFDDHTLLHQGLGCGNGSGGGCDSIDIDSNNNSSSFCMIDTDHSSSTAIGKGASIGSPTTPTITYDTVSLPPIDSLMKTTSPKYSTSASQQHIFDMDLLESGVSTHVPDLVDDYFNTSSSLIHSSHHEPAPQPHHHNHHHHHHHHHHHDHEFLDYQQSMEQHHQHSGMLPPPEQQQHHEGEMISSSLHTDTAASNVRLPRHVYSTEQISPVHHPHHTHQLHHHHQQQLGGPMSTVAEFQCLPNDTLSPADLINISLGASDVNISFETGFGDTAVVGGLTDTGSHNLLSYERGTDDIDGAFGDGTGFDLLTATHTTNETDGQSDKMHSRFSSSSDSLITLHDTGGGLGGAKTATPTPPAIATIAGNPGLEGDTDKKYVCEVCLRKYMTKSNLDKHVRKHNLYLCVFCMKLFQQADELKDHECSERKSKTAYLHCPKCLKVLSNSWSLQRHMKIHKDLTQDESAMLAASGGVVSVEQLEKLSGDGTNGSKASNTSFEDFSNPAPIEDIKPSIEALEGSANMAALRLAIHSDDKSVILDSEMAASNPPPLLTEAEIKKEPSYGYTGSTPASPATNTSHLPNLTTVIPITNMCSSQDMITNVQAANGKQLYKCIVCSKLFKNPNALEKHLRKVHTVYTVSNDYKSEKKGGSVGGQLRMHSKKKHSSGCTSDNGGRPSIDNVYNGTVPLASAQI
uniref:Uncharacterized protein n=1 Tax=Anopheles maculatus TaxID=74869 RepID=A0A182S8W6_9DIPT